MATPGYPQMMGGGPMGPPVGGMPMPRPMRRGTSKAVPVVVAAGLAVGVFCGLLFGVGTGKDKPKTDDKPVKVTATEAAPEGLGASTTTPPSTNPTAPKPATAPAAGSGSAAPQAGSAGSGAAVAKTEPTVKTAKLTIQIKPDEAAKDAKIQINGNDITGSSVDLPLEQKSVKLAIKSPLYHSIDKTLNVDLQAGDETKIEIEMQKRGGGGGGSPGFGGASHSAPQVPKAPPGPPKTPKPKGGGVIDI